MFLDSEVCDVIENFYYISMWLDVLQSYLLSELQCGIIKALAIDSCKFAECGYCKD